MDSGYVAYGMALRCPFPLPGMVAGEPGGLPAVALELVAPAEIEAAWDDERPSWRGRLGDGREFAIAWGPGGDLLFSYEGWARFRFVPARGLLECAPLDPDDLSWKRVLLSRVLPNLSLAHGREALHASAVESPYGVVAIAGPSGTGKSTLAAELMRRGWPLFTDDVLVLAAGTVGTVGAFPGTPHLTLASSPPPDLRGVTLGILGGERWVSIERAARVPRGVAAIFLYERGPEQALAIRPLPPSPLALAPYMLGLPDEDERERARFSLYSDLISSARIFRLTAEMASKPSALADRIESALDRSPESVVGGVA